MAITKKTAVKTTAKAKAVESESEKKVKKAAVKKTSKKAEPTVIKAEAPKSVKAAKKSATVKSESDTKKTAQKAPVKKAVKASKESVKKVPEQTELKLVQEKSSTRKTASKAKKINVENDTLAHSFNLEYLVLMQKDPNWMHAFWEVSESRVRAVTKGKAKLVLRLFDVSTDLTVKKNRQRRSRDIVVPANARSWYVETTDSKENVAVLGTLSGKTFTPIVESLPIVTFDKNANAPALDDTFIKASLGGASIGNFMSSGVSSQTASSWLESLRLGSSSESFFSGTLSSGALSNANADILQGNDSVNYGKDFFLWVKTRLIVYGGTRPDAHLQVRGEPFPLNPDGTFSFEEDLPDVTKVIPVFATDKDGDFPTTIVPVVVKRTE